MGPGTIGTTHTSRTPTDEVIEPATTTNAGLPDDPWARVMGYLSDAEVGRLSLVSTQLARISHAALEQRVLGRLNLPELNERERHLLFEQKHVGQLRTWAAKICHDLIMHARADPAEILKIREVAQILSVYGVRNIDNGLAHLRDEPLLDRFRRGNLDALQVVLQRILVEHRLQPVKQELLERLVAAARKGAEPEMGQVVALMGDFPFCARERSQLDAALESLPAAEKFRLLSELAEKGCKAAQRVLVRAFSTDGYTKGGSDFIDQALSRHVDENERQERISRFANLGWPQAQQEYASSIANDQKIPLGDRLAKLFELGEHGNKFAQQIYCDLNNDQFNSNLSLATSTEQKALIAVRAHQFFIKLTQKNWNGADTCAYNFLVDSYCRYYADSIKSEYVTMTLEQLAKQGCASAQTALVEAIDMGKYDFNGLTENARCEKIWQLALLGMPAAQKHCITSIESGKLLASKTHAERHLEIIERYTELAQAGCQQALTKLANGAQAMSGFSENIFRDRLYQLAMNGNVEAQKKLHVLFDEKNYLHQQQLPLLDECFHIVNLLSSIT